MKVDISEEVLKNWGVYKITNMLNGDFYIGSTIENFKKRVIHKHLSDYILWKNDKCRRRACPILYNAFEKYGVDNFKVEVLISFARKKESKTNKEIATFLEERYINRLKPKYNICQKPTLSGCPNLGRKLSKEWKQKISEKSKLYKHSNNKAVYDKKSQQNKELSSVYRISKDNYVFEGSAIDCSRVISCRVTSLFSLRNGTVKGWKVEKLKSQSKAIRIFNNSESKEFSSFAKCDKYLNMWRGYTSTCIVNKKDTILDYKYELL